jgi:hypothetical protein
MSKICQKETVGVDGNILYYEPQFHHIWLMCSFVCFCSLLFVANSLRAFPCLAVSKEETGGVRWKQSEPLNRKLLNLSHLRKGFQP